MSDAYADTYGETDLERLSAVLHRIYQDEARRQASTGDDKVRHPDAYTLLPEHTKEYDRVLARYILAREAVIVGEALSVGLSVADMDAMGIKHDA